MGSIQFIIDSTIHMSGREPLRSKPEGHWSLGKLIADTLLNEG